MNCATCQELFSEHFDGALPPERAEGVQSHLAMCIECAQEYRLFQKSMGVLHDTGPIETREGFASYVVTAATQPIEAIACAGYEQLFSDHYDDALAPDRRREFESHLVACAGCRADYAVLMRSMRALAAKGPVSAPLGFERMVRPPKIAPNWIPLAMAASVVIAFAVGYFVQRSAVRGELEERNTAIARLQKDLAEATKPVVLPDNIARINGHEFPIEEYLERHLTAMGLVRERNGYIPRDMKERFEKGESLIDGKWVNVAAEIQRRTDAEIARIPKPPVAPTEEEILAKHDLVKTQSGYLPRAFVERLQAGDVLTADNTWREMKDIVADAMRDRRLVEHDGRWMTEEQRAELLAAQRVQNPGGLATPAAAALDRLAIGAPSGWKNLMIYPLSKATAAGPVTWTTLHDALGAGKVVVTDAGAPHAVKVQNGGAADLVLFGGELLVGGRFARVVARDTIVEKGRTETVEVFDAEPGALRAGTQFARESGHFFVTPDLRRALVMGPGQGAVWAHHQRLLAALAPKGASTADAYKAAADPIAEIRAALIDLRESTPDVVGIAVVIGDRVEYAEVFEDHATFCAAYERILRAAALEATMRAALPRQKNPVGLPGTVAGVKRLLESTFEATHDVEGDSIAIRREGEPFGAALLRGGAAVHVVVFGTAESEPGRAVVKLPGPKQDALFLAYEARLKGAGLAGRTAVFAELASLPIPEATTRLGMHLTDADVATRRAVIVALGRRGDPAAVEALLNVVNEAKRDPALFPAAVQAVARLGHVKAVDPLLRVIDGNELEPSLVVAAALPELLLQIRDRETLERALGRMLDAYERAMMSGDFAPKGAEAQLAAALKGSIELTTGRTFASPTKARMWWNMEGKKFLDDRTK